MSNITVPLSIRYGNIPINYSPTPAQYVDAFQKRIEMSISGDSVLIGNISNTEPTYNKGPWFSTTDHSWRYWSESKSKYISVNHAIQSGSNKITLAGSPTVSRTIAFPDASGTVATLVDVYVPRATQAALFTGSPTIDVTASDTFVGKLPSNYTVTISGAVNGSIIKIAFINAGTSYTVTWPASVKWPTLPAPMDTVQSSAPSAGDNATSVYIFRASNVTGSLLLYGEHIKGYGAPTATTYTPDGPSSVPDDYPVHLPQSRTQSTLPQ